MGYSHRVTKSQTRLSDSLSLSLSLSLSHTHTHPHTHTLSSCGTQALEHVGSVFRGIERNSLSCVRLFVTPRTIQFMEYSRPVYLSG